MHRIIIVEDEPLLGDFLQNNIIWNEIDVTVATICNNGQDALIAIERYVPDIVLTDINMPIMDGIQLIKKCHEKNINIPFVILSGYDDFHLVKESFKLGVTDYFLKSELDCSELMKTIAKILKSKDETFDYSKQEFLVRERTLKELIWGAKQLENGSDKGNIKITNSNITMAILRILNYKYILKKHWDKDSELLKYAIHNVVGEILSAESNIETLINNEEIIFLFSGEKRSQIEDNVNKTTSFFQKYFKDEFEMQTAVGYCGYTDDTLKLKYIYDNCQEAVYYSAIITHFTAVGYHNEINKSKKETINKDALLTKFEKHITKYAFSEILDNFEEYTFKNVHISDIHKLMDLYKAYFTVVSYVLTSIQDAQKKNYTEENLLSKGDMNKLNEQLYEIIFNMNTFINDDGMVSLKVQKYIEKNYFKNITLETVANEFQVGYQKLSREFSKKTGQSFKKYLIGIRMKQATELMMSTDYHLYEIADMVGYANYENFSRVFYGYYGKWPKDFNK